MSEPNTPPDLGLQGAAAAADPSPGAQPPPPPPYSPAPPHSPPPSPSADARGPHVSYSGPPTIGYAAPPLAQEREARTWAMLCHISALAGLLIPFGSIIGPLVVWQVKKEQYPIVDDQGKESLNFQITAAIAMVVSFLLVFVFIGFLLLPVVGIGALVLTIIGGVKANDGTVYRYPINIRFIR